jgi:hypothetical protein
LAAADTVRQVANKETIMIVCFIIFRSIWELVKTVVASVVSIIYRVLQRQE